MGTPLNLTFKSYAHLTDYEVEFVLALRNEWRVRKFMLHSNIITLDEHKAYVERLAYATEQVAFLVSADGKNVGVFQLKALDREQGIWDYGYFFVEHSGCFGYVKTCMLRCYAILGIKEIHSCVHKDNKTGIRTAEIDGASFAPNATDPNFLDFWFKVDYSKLELLKELKFARLKYQFIL